MEPAEAKNRLEYLHIRYLVKHLNLKARGKRDGWDVYTDKHDFELKSALYYMDTRRAPKDNIWFNLHESQRKEYEKEAKNELYWIFIGSTRRKPLDQVKKLDERYVLHRDIVFAPWVVYNHFPIGNARKDSKRGPARSPSIKKVKELFFKKKYKLHKADIYLPEHGALDYLLKYTLD